MRKTFMPIVAAGALFAAGACSGGEHEAAPTTITVPSTTSEAPTTTVPGLHFDPNPEGNLSVLDCQRDPSGWAMDIDPFPLDLPNENDEAQTLGIVGQFDKDGHPSFIGGVIIKKLGNLNYRVATSNPDEIKVLPEVIHLDEGPVAEVIETETQDAVFSARIGSDGKAYFALNCLSIFDDFSDAPAPSVDPPNTAIEPAPTIPPDSVTA